MLSTLANTMNQDHLPHNHKTYDHRESSLPSMFSQSVFSPNLSSSSSTFQLPPISSLTFEPKQSSPNPSNNHHLSSASSAGSAPYSNRSCDECRRRKVKCDRRKNFCNQCFRNGLLCTYNDPILKRGRRPKAQPLTSHRNSISEEVKSFHHHHHQMPSIDSLPESHGPRYYQTSSYVNRSPEIYQRNPASLPTPVATSHSTFTPSPPSDPSQFPSAGGSSGSQDKFDTWKDSFTSDLQKYSLSSQSFQG